MADLTLYIDPNEAGYPSTVRELLNDVEKRKANLCAAVSPYGGKCLLICNNHIYVWTSVATGSIIPNGIHMELPPTGLKYSTQLVCLFKKAQNHKQQSMLAISPEGYVRYWAELGKQPKNEECILNNEVAHSIQLIDSQDQVHRFLLTTTTGSFHIIDLFHGFNQPDRLATRPLDVGGPGGGIGRRMSLLLFGSLTAEKERIIKTLIIQDQAGSSVDVVNVLNHTLRFYSIAQKKQVQEVDVADLALSKYNKSREQAERRHFRIVDAVQYKNGILLFLVGEKQSAEGGERRFQIDRNLFIACYKEPKELAAPHSLHSLIQIELPERLTATGLEKRLQTATLLCPAVEECCIVFYDSLLYIRHPTNPNTISTLLLDSYATEGTTQRHASQQFSPKRSEGDKLLGATAVNGFCQLVLKEAGICTVRRLPHHYDLHFWKKYHVILDQLDHIQEEYPAVAKENRFKDAFVAFCAKNIKDSKNKLRELMEHMQNSVREEEELETEDRDRQEGDGGGETSTSTDEGRNKQENLAEMAAELLLYFLDRQPTAQEDPRWAYSPDEPIIEEQRVQLAELAETKKFDLIHRQLRIKMAFYKLFVLFLRTFNLVEWIDYPLQAFMRSGKAVIAELGEKLLAAITTFHWLSEHCQSLPLINRALSELAKQYVTKYGLPKGNPFLSPTDYVFNKVSVFHELVSAAIQAGQQAMEEDSNSPTRPKSNQTKANIINEVGALLITMIEGVDDAHMEEWAMQLQGEYSTWLNQPDFLTHFTTHLNTALDYLATLRNPAAPSDQTTASTHSSTQSEIIFAQCTRLAHFVLSQQSANQRNDSKIITRFYELGHRDFALDLAEKYEDFTFLVVYCHNRLDDRRRAEALDRYKEKYGNNFYNFLYTWYQQKGMFNHLLAENGQKAREFLAERQEINWIRQIEEGKYAQARKTLKQMSQVEKDENKKLIELSLCKLTALCEDQENVDEIAELSRQIRALREKRGGGGGGSGGPETRERQEEMEE